MYIIIRLFKHSSQLHNLHPTKWLQPIGVKVTYGDVGIVFNGVSQDLLRRTEYNKEITGTRAVGNRPRIEPGTHRIWRSTNQCRRYFVGRDLKGSHNSLFYSGVPNDPTHSTNERDRNTINTGEKFYFLIS